MPTTLLAIDDDADVRTLVREVADGLGYEVRDVADFPAFRDAFKASTPHVIVMDLAIPGVDGIEILKFLSDSNFDGGVLLISAMDPIMLEAATQLGKSRGLTILGALGKPLRPERLSEILNGSS